MMVSEVITPSFKTGGVVAEDAGLLLEIGEGKSKDNSESKVVEQVKIEASPKAKQEEPVEKKSPETAPESTETKTQESVGEKRSRAENDSANESKETKVPRTSSEGSPRDEEEDESSLERAVVEELDKGSGEDGKSVIEFALEQNWHTSYVRTRHKNLRCFPFCSPSHRERSFCGLPVTVFVKCPSIQAARKLHLVGRFRKVRDDPLALPGAPLKNLTSSQNKVVMGTFAQYNAEDKTAIFEFAPPRKWRYHCEQNKYTTSEMHAFTVHMFNHENVCIDVKDSPHFRIVSAWRQSVNTVSRPFNPLLQRTFSQQQQALAASAAAAAASGPIANPLNAAQAFSMLPGPPSGASPASSSSDSLQASFGLKNGATGPASSGFQLLPEQQRYLLALQQQQLMQQMQMRQMLMQQPQLMDPRLMASTSQFGASLTGQQQQQQQQQQQTSAAKSPQFFYPQMASLYPSGSGPNPSV